MLGVALAAVQVAAVGPHFELVLVSPFQGANYSLQVRLGYPLGQPLGAGRKERAEEDLKAVQMMQLWPGRQQLWTQGRRVTY